MRPTTRSGWGRRSRRYPEVADAYIDDAQIQVAVMLAAEMPKPTWFPAVMKLSAFSFFLPMRRDMRNVPP